MPHEQRLDLFFMYQLSAQNTSSSHPYAQIPLKLFYFGNLFAQIKEFSWPHSRQGMILSVESKRKTLKMHLGLPRKLTLVTKIEWVGIAMNIMSIGICSFYFPLNTSRFASINLCTIIKLCNTFLFVMSPRKNERVSTIESSVEQAELKILRNVTVSLAITKDQEMLCRCCFATA